MTKMTINHKSLIRILLKNPSRWNFRLKFYEILDI